MHLHLTTAQYSELRANLFDAAERVVFMFARCVTSPHHAHVADIRLLDDHDYIHRNRYGVELAHHVRPEVIRTAHEHRYAVVEAHAHNWPGPRTCFSSTDIEGLYELGPHMTWRLPGRPYTALVLGQDSFDALQWHPEGHITTIEALVIDGESRRPTGLSSTHRATIKPTGRPK